MYPATKLTPLLLALCTGLVACTESPFDPREDAGDGRTQIRPDTGTADSGPVEDSGAARVDAAVEDSGNPASDAGNDTGTPADLDAGDASTANDAGIDAAVGLGDPAACAPCEQTVPQDSSCYQARAKCSEATGTAEHGPKASAPKAELCEELIACFWSSGCGAKGNWNDCFCGEGVDCLLTSATAVGPCKDEVLAAAETTDAADVNNRLYNTDYASGLALQLADCDLIYCPYECAFCTPNPLAGDAGDPLCHPASPDGGL